VPVPSIPASSLALPPEHPGLPPMGLPQTSEPGAPQKALAHPAAPQAASPAPVAPAPLAAGEEAAYKQALNATLAGRTDEGLRLFHDFLQKYPHGRYAANADYWIGEGLYAQGKYQDALAQFQKVNDAYPQHHKNADALLKAGMTMSRLGDKAAASEKYRALMAQFPNSEAARRARAMGVAR
ncbi:MAG: tol-pal system protein YbgF, partial [Desulfovibrio sp.]|nr:tol-pal system protein YbgF [Desulfovibrio sp.]